MSESLLFKVTEWNGDEPNLEQIVLEDWAEHLMSMDLEDFAVLRDGTLILCDQCGNFRYTPEGRFKLVWRKGDKT